MDGVLDRALRTGAGWLSRVVDPLVLPSFDRTGYRIHSLTFDPGDLEVDLSGRLCLVTGANSGIGFETSRALALRGAEVVLLCRNAERGEAAAAAIRRETGRPDARFEALDVSDLDSVRKAAARLGAAPVHVLVHNAGVLPDQRRESPQGLEETFATHVAGPFLLTRLLRPNLEAAGDARVVWVSSGGMYTRRLSLADPQWTTRRRYDGVVAYAETKRAQVVLSELFARRLWTSGVRVNAMHPGWADTPAVRSSLPGFHRVMRQVLRTPAEGADTVVWLAASPAAADATGLFFFDRVPRSPYWLPFTREREEEREALWRICEGTTAP